ncbi:MAG: hypothetical protein DA407_03165 [Bacteroidetes bacterium]|nr:MAG: hypothetical protein DA407_03165 [Bacteroidota bacterium]
MKTSKTILKNITLLIVIIAGFISCEKDFASIDSDVVNSDNTSNFSTDFLNFPVRTYNKKITPFQTNGLPVNLLGFYNDDLYGSSAVNFVGQMVPTAYDPSFGENIVLDSVVFTMPYFSRQTEIDEDGNSTYELDSIFGDKPIKLSIYKNNFFLRDFNPDLEFDETQKYFSNGSSSGNDLISVSELEGQLLYQNDAFIPSPDEIRLTKIELDENDDPVLDEDDNPVTSVTNRLSPGIRVHLDNPNDTFWQELIFNKEGQPQLSNQNNFINHFRGLYLKAEAVDADGTMMLLNLSTTATNITIYYTSDIETDVDTGTDSEIDTEPGQFIMNFSGSSVSLYDNDLITIPDGDTVNGDETIYLKGGEGSMAIVELFKGTVEDENGAQVDAFEYFKNSFREDNGDDTFTQKRLINEAYLEFYVNHDLMSGEEQEPDRIYLFDTNRETALIDYFLDQSVSNSQINAKVIHLEPLKRVNDEPDGEGIKYKVRITEHLNNIILRDSSNVKLGLVVTTNVNTITNYASKNEDDEDGVKQVPAGVILSPRGTVLYGNNTTNEKKVKLTIYYTEPDN